MSTEATDKIFTLPNLISIIRLLLVPIFALLLVAYENNLAAFIVFFIAAVTDFVDGAVARSTGQVSQLGQKLDPLVDRVLILTAVILIYVVGRVPLWVLLLIVARDLSMMILLGQLRADGKSKFKVTLVGKAATAVLMTGFCSLILNWPMLDGFGLFDSPFFPGWGTSSAALGIWLVYLGVVLAWIAGIFYLLRAYFSSKRQQGKSPKSDRGQTKGDSGTRVGREEGTSSFHDGYVYSPGQRPRNSAVNTRVSERTAALKQRKSGTLYPSRTQSLQGKEGRDNRQNRDILGVALSILNTPRRMIIALSLTLLFVATLGFYCVDGISNFGVIHSGVRVGTVDVGHMEEAEATAHLNTNLNEIANSTPVLLFANEVSATIGEIDSTQHLGYGVNSYNQAETDVAATSWSTTLATFDAEVNGSSLAKEAYEVGRGGDFFFGRLAASIGGVTVTPRLEFSGERLKGVEEMLTRAIGTPMQNANITFDGSNFIAMDGQDGYVVDEEQFKLLLEKAFFTDERKIVVPMVDRSRYITLEDARKVAEATQLAIAEPVLLSYNDDAWTLTVEQLGHYISTSVERDQSGEWQLIARVDATLLETLLPEVTGHIEDQIAPLNARFEVVEGELQIAPSEIGTGVDYVRLANDLNALLFEETPEEASIADEGAAEGDEVISDAASGADGESAFTQERVVVLNIGIKEPEILTSDAEAYGFSTKIAEYTIEFGWPSLGTVINIQTAAYNISSSIVSPGGIWSFNEIAGECTEEKGYVTARVILGDEFVDEIGGGVCSVASSVFNAAYEAGYPILERINHSLRLERYPLGRDAAIAYPYADLKFQNDTENYLLLTMTYSEHNVTCTLWGVPPGYTVESTTGELIEGEDFKKKEVVDEELAPGQSILDQAGMKASRVDVTRTVYDAEGNVKEQKTFYSAYDATPEVTKIGPKPEQ